MGDESVGEGESSNTVLDVNVVATKNSRSTPSSKGKESQHYTPEIVVSLLRSMRDVGFGNRRESKKSMKDIFEAAVQHAK